MRVLLSIAVIISILLQTFRQAEILFSYHLNQTYIAENLCVNRSKPEMHCNGKCHLKKELKEAEESGEKHPVSAGQMNDLVLACNDFRWDFKQLLAASVFLPVRSFGFIYTDPCKEIFHPPCCFC